MARTLPILLEAKVSSNEHCDRTCMFMRLGTGLAHRDCALPALWGEEQDNLVEDKISELPRRTHSCRIATGQKP